MSNISNDYNVSSSGAEAFKPLITVFAARAEARAAYNSKPHINTKAGDFINACSSFFAALHNHVTALRFAKDPAVEHYDHVWKLSKGIVHPDHLDSQYADLPPSDIPLLMAQIDLARGNKDLTDKLKIVQSTGQTYLDSRISMPPAPPASLFFYGH